MVIVRSTFLIEFHKSRDALSAMGPDTRSTSFKSPDLLFLTYCWVILVKKIQNGCPGTEAIQAFCTVIESFVTLKNHISDCILKCHEKKPLYSVLECCEGTMCLWTFQRHMHEAWSTGAQYFLGTMCRGRHILLQTCACIGPCMQ